MTKDFFTAEKKIYDSIHGFIHFEKFIQWIIDTEAFQRLHFIRQLGLTYLVYPGATHTRFEHSLGVMELATQIFHHLCKNARPDVFAHVPRKGSPDYHYWRKVLRIAALCHDLGHLPFSHAVEKELLQDIGHEGMTCKLLQSAYFSSIFEQIQEEIIDVFPGRNICEDVCKIAVGETTWKKIGGQAFSQWEKILSSVITSDAFGADRMDYLLRDAKSTGVAYGLFDYKQLIESLCILPDKKTQELVIGIHENGFESCEALFLARHFMYERVYQHPSVKAYNFHLRRFLQKSFPKNGTKDLAIFVSYNDNTVLYFLQQAAKDSKHPCYGDARSIFLREKRFQALPIAHSFSKKQFAVLCEEKGIPPHAFSWEESMHKSAKEKFPIFSKRHGGASSKDCSDLFSRVSSEYPDWIYYSRDYEIPVSETIDQLKE